MKTFLLWLVAVTIATVVICTGAHFWYSSHPQKVLILVDSSYAMEVWSFDVEERLSRLLGSRYTVFSVGDFNRPLQDFSRSPEIPVFAFYGPRPDLDQITFIRSQTAVSNADRILILSNLQDSDVFRFDSRVEIIGLEPFLN